MRIVPLFTSIALLIVKDVKITTSLDFRLRVEFKRIERKEIQHLFSNRSKNEKAGLVWKSERSKRIFLLEIRMETNSHGLNIALDPDGISICLPFHILSARYRGWRTGVSRRKFRPGAGRRPEAGNVIRKGASSDVRTRRGGTARRHLFKRSLSRWSVYTCS